MRRMTQWTRWPAAVVALVLVVVPTWSGAGAAPASEPSEEVAIASTGRAIRHPARPLVRRIRMVLPTAEDFASVALGGLDALRAVPPCPGVRPSGPIPVAKAARSFLVLVEPDQLVVTQVLAYRTPREASDALTSWFRETARDCARYGPASLFGSEPLDEDLAVTVTNRRTDAPVRTGDERRAIRTRVVLRTGEFGRLEVFDGVGAAYRQGRYLVFAESSGAFGSDAAGQRADRALLGDTIESMFARLEAERLPGRG